MMTNRNLSYGEIEEILVKSIENLTERECKILLKEVSNILGNKISKAYTEVEEISEEVEETSSISEKNLLKLFKICGIPAQLKGYRYLISAILYYSDYIKKYGYTCSMTKELYPHVAHKYNVGKYSKVERSIRHAIEVAWQRGDPKTLNDIFGFTLKEECGKPTNSEFIAMVVEYFECK